MNAISYIDDWRNLENVEIIDVRSPAEFENDHIPGSITVSYTHLTLPTNREV